MKKIILLIAVSFLFVSCDNNSVSEKEESKRDKEFSVSIPDLKSKVSRLEWIKLGGMESERLKMISFELDSVYNRGIIEKAIKETDVKICEKLEKDFIDSCKVGVFKKKWEKDYCDKLSDSNNIKNCKNDYNKNMAFEKMDIKYCEKLEWEKIDECKIKIFNKKWEKNYCDKLSDSNNIKSCKNDYNRNMAFEKMDITYCDKLEWEDDLVKSRCKTEIFIEKARKNKDVKICNSIQEEWEKRMCKDRVNVEKEMEILDKTKS